MPRIPIIEELTSGPVPRGSFLVVEFTGASQWYNASFAIAAGWLKNEGKVIYLAFAHSPTNIRERLNTLGVNSEQLEREDKLRIGDGYAATLGQKSKEKYVLPSLKVTDLSIMYSRDLMRQRQQLVDWLRISDNSSTLTRFNDEKSFVELMLTRTVPTQRMQKLTSIGGFMRGIHSSWVYEQTEAASDGIIDFKLDDTADPPRNLIRIRSMKNVGFDGRWHQLKIDENFDVTLEK